MNLLIPPKQVNAGTRLASMFLDHIFMCAILGFICGPVMFFNIMRISSNSQADVNPFSNGILYVFDIGFALYFCKDCIAGRSLAKRILKLQVINNKTGEVASPFRCLVRDLFCVLWPVEVIVTLVNPSRRVGDFVAGTRVDYFNPTEVAQPKPDVIKIGSAFLIAYLLLALLNVGLQSILHF